MFQKLVFDISLMKETISDAGSSWICLLAYFVPAVLEVLIFSNCKDQLEHLLISAKAVLNVSIDNLSINIERLVWLNSVVFNPIDIHINTMG